MVILNAGLYWAQRCTAARFKCGVLPRLGWECLYHHETHGLFRSIYVDDVWLVGFEDQIAATWTELQTYLDIEQHIDLHGPVSLGVKQHGVPPGLVMVSAKRER